MISIVIRSLNEQKFIGECLAAIGQQTIQDEVEIILVDSGSTDKTIEIARAHSAKIVNILPKQFSFGRSLNMGCEVAKGEVLILLSAHCVPSGKLWLDKLVTPILDGECDYTYSRQIGRQPYTKFSEERIFRQYFPNATAVPQDGFFCNNASAAIRRSTWYKIRFDEELTGLEDLALAKKLTTTGGKIGYVAESCVEHIHEETWERVRIRFEREALALRHIMPEVLVNAHNAVRYCLVAILDDLIAYLKSNHKKSLSGLSSIVLYRYFQFLGTWKGNNLSRSMAKQNRLNYYYPRSKEPKNEKNRRIITDESEQRARER